MEAILEAVKELNELLYDCVIPNLFNELYDVETHEITEEYKVELVKLSKDDYTFSAAKDLIVRKEDTGDDAGKSFHLDAYYFDSQPELAMFWNLLRSGRVKKLYFTGMLTHGQTDFYIQYIVPDSYAIRSYYPDFLFRRRMARW